MQAGGHAASQRLRSRVHQHIGPESIGDEAEPQLTLRIGEANAATRTWMAERARPHGERCIGNVRLIEPATQAEAR